MLSRFVALSVSLTWNASPLQDMPKQHCGAGARTYNGQSYDTVSPGINPSSNMFTISFSFKTTNSEGVIFVCGQDDVAGGYTSDHIVFELLQGKLHFDFAPGADVCNINMNSAARLDDGKWHTVSATRIDATTGSLRVDGADTFGHAMGNCGASGVDLTLPVYIGGHPTHRNAVCDPTIAAAQGCTPGGGVQVGSTDVGSRYGGTSRQTGLDAQANFAGCLSGILYEEEYKVINGRGTPSGAPITEGQCAGGHDGATAAGEFTGQSYLTYQKGANPRIQFFTMSFSFKTGGDGALVVCHGGQDNADHSANGGDYVVLEVVGGKVKFGFSAGVDPDGLESAVAITHSITVTDNEWHHVTAARDGILTAALTVDDITMRGSDPVGKFIGIDLSLPMYIGGHPSYRVNGLTATTPIVGCMTDVSYSMNFGPIRHVRSIDGHYEAVPHPMSYTQARQYCQQNDYDLASIHSSQEQQIAADECAKLTQQTRAATSTECRHTLAHGDVNVASSAWISNSEEWVFVGCFVSDQDGGSHGDPWPDTGSNWKDLNWEQCRQAARTAGYNTFVMEHPAGYDAPGHASCGHMESIAHGNYHGGSAGHNDQGRAPDTDCASEVDTEGHLLGGPWRFALYATQSTALCLQQSIGEAPLSNVHNVDECIPEDYVPAVGNPAGDLWMMVGCFVSDQDGGSHADPWSDGQRWVDSDWYGCRQKAVDEGSAIFVMEYGQGYEQQGHASCGHMNVINHGNFHVSSDSHAQHFLNVMGGSHAGDTGHNGFGRAPLEDCTGEIDDAGHALGGPWRFAVYAEHDIAVCLNDFSSRAVIGETSPHGCWIGLTDEAGEGGAADDSGRFGWSDDSPVNYAHW